LGNVRFRRGSIAKSVCVIMAVAVSLHHQQSDNFCKIQKENAKQTWAPIYAWPSFSFFPLGPLYMCVLYYSWARGACPLQHYWLLNLFTWPTLMGTIFVRGTGRDWTAGLVTAGCLAVQLRLWHPWHTFRTSLNGTDVIGHSCLVTLCQQSVQLFCWASANLASCCSRHYKLCMQHCGFKVSLKADKWNAISGALNGALQMKGWQIKVCLLLPFLSPSPHFQCIPSAVYVHSPDPTISHTQARWTEQCIITTSSLLAVPTNSLINKWIMGVSIKG
jgi:hypothetical protein